MDGSMVWIFSDQTNNSVNWVYSLLIIHHSYLPLACDQKIQVGEF